MRLAQNQATSQYNLANNNGAQYGDAAKTVGNPLTSFLLSRLNSPSGYSQPDLTAMLSSALGSEGGATSAISGQAEQQAGRTRNAAGFDASLAEAAREKAKGLAATSEGIAGKNADVKLGQQSDAARMLQGLYGTDVNAQGDQQKIANANINTEVEAGKSGWFQNLTSLLGSINGAGFKGFKI